MFSSLGSLLHSFRIPFRRRSVQSVFSRRGRRRSFVPSLGSHSSLGVSLHDTLSHEPLEQRRLLAADVNLDGTVLTVAFDDAGTDFISLSMNATGYQTTGANVTSGTGTITKLVVTDAGTAFPSCVSILDASQQLTGGLSVGQNVYSVDIAAPIDTAGGDVAIDSSQLTLARNISTGGGSQTYGGAVALLSDAVLSSSGSSAIDYGEVSVIGDVSTSGLARDVATSPDGQYGYVATGTRLAVYDLSNAYSPTELSSIELGGEASGVAVSGSYAYVAAFTAGLRIINISDPQNLVSESQFTDSGTMKAANGVTIDGSYAYIADEAGGLRIVDVTDVTSPSSVGVYHASDAYGVAVSGNYAYLADGSATDNFRVINISDPSTPVLLSEISLGGSAYEVAISGSYAYVAAGANGLRVVDISDPASVSEVGSYPTTQHALGVAMSPDNANVFVTTGEGGTIIGSGGSQNVSDWGGEVLTLDISTPTAPVLSSIAALPSVGEGIAVSSRGYGFVADAGQGLQSLAFGSTIAGDISFQSTIDGGHRLRVLDVHGSTRFDGEIGGNNPLASFEVGGLGQVVMNASVTSTGLQSYVVDLSLLNDITLTASGIELHSQILAGNNNLTLNGSATGVVLDDVVLSRANNLTVVGDATVSGTFDTQAIDFQGNLTLIDDASLVAGQTQPNLTAVTGPEFSWDVVEPQNATGHAASDQKGRGAVVSPDGTMVALLSEENGITLWDITDPSSPSNITNTTQPILWDTANGTYAAEAWGAAFSQSGDELYVVGEAGTAGIGFAKIDISDPANASVTGTINSTEFGGGSPYFVEVTADGQTAAISLQGNGTTGGLALVDLDTLAVSTFTSYESGGSTVEMNSTEGLALSSDGKYAFLGSQYNKNLTIVDISDPDNPAYTSSVETGTDIWTIVPSFDDQFLYVGGQSGVGAINITTIETPTVATNIATFNDGNGSQPLRTFGLGLSADGLTLFAGSAGSYSNLTTSVVAYDVSVPTAPAFGGFLSQPAVSLTNFGFYNRVTTTPDGRTMIASSFGFTVANEGAVYNFYEIPYDSVASGTINVGGSIDGDGSGNHKLVLETASGSATIGGAIGSTHALESVFILDDGTTSVGGNVTVTNTFDTLGQLILSDDVTFTAGSVVLDGGADAGANDLTINATSAVVLDAGTAAFSNLANLSISGEATLNGSIQTTGNQSFGGAVSLNGQTSLVSGAGEIHLDGGVSGTSTSLTLGDGTQTGDIRAGVNFQVHTLSIGTGAFDVEFNTTSATYVANQTAPVEFKNSGNVTLSGPGQTFAGGISTAGVANTFVAGCVSTWAKDITLDNVTMLDSSYNHRFDTRWTGVFAAGANINISNFKSTLSPSPTSVEFDIGNTTNTLTLSGSTQSTNFLQFKGSGSVNVLGPANLAGEVAAQNLTYFGLPQENTIPALNFNDNVTLTGAMEFEGTTATFTNGVEGAGNDLTLNFTQTATLDGFSNVGNFTSLGAVDLNGNFNTSGFQKYEGNVSLDGDTELGATTVEFADGVTGNSNNLTLSPTSSYIKLDGIQLSGVNELTIGGDLELAGNLDAQNIDIQGNTTLLGDANLTATGTASGDWSTASLTNTVVTSGSAMKLTLSPDGRHAYIADDNEGMQVVDLQHPSGPAIVGTFNSGVGNAFDVVANATHAFVSHWMGDLHIVDVSNPSSPQSTGNVSLPDMGLPFGGSPFGLSLHGNALYVADGQAGIHHVDVSDPANPSVSETFGTGATFFGVTVAGGYTFAATSAGLKVYDVARTNVATASLSGNGDARSVVVSADGQTAFLANFNGGLDIFDISTPSNPQLLDSYSTAGYGHDVALSSDESLAFVADGPNGKLVLDVSDTSDIKFVGNHATTGSDNDGNVYDVAVASDDAATYTVTHKSENDPGKAGLDIFSAVTQGILFGGTVDGGHDLTANSSSVTFAGGVGNTTPLTSLTTTTNTTAVIAGGSIKTSGNQTYGGVVDLPANTELIGDTGSFAAGVEAAGNDLTLNFTSTTALDSSFANINDLASEGDVTLNGSITTGTQIYNGTATLTGDTVLTADDNIAVFVPNYADPQLAGNFTTSGSAYDSALSSDGKYAFVADGGSGLQIIDVSNVAAPTPVGNLATDWAFDVKLSSDGKYAFVADESSGLTIIDVSNVANPQQVGQYDTLFANGVTLSSDGQYAFVADFGSGLRIIDVSNVADPQQVGQYDTSGNAFDVTLSSDGQHAFVADDTSGLQIIDVSNVADPQPVGNFTTSGRANGVTLSSDDQYAFVANRSGLQIIDVSNVANPTPVGNFATSDHANGVTLSSDDQYAFVAAYESGLQIIDVSNVANPQPTGHYDASNYALGVELSSDGQYAFVADWNDGLQIISLGSEETGAVIFSGTVDGGHALAVNGSSVEFADGVGSTTPLASLTTTTNTTAVIAGGSIETSGNQAYGGNVTLSGNANFTGNAATFTNGVLGGNNSLTINFTQPSKLDGLANINEFTSLGQIELNGSFQTAGSQNFAGGVSLGGDATLHAASNFIKLNGIAGETYDLTIGNTTLPAPTANLFITSDVALNALNATTGNYDASLTGASMKLQQATFDNSGDITLGDQATDSLVIDEGLIVQNAAVTTVAGTIASNGSEIAIRNINLTSDTHIDTTNSGMAKNGGAQILLDGNMQLNGFTLDTKSGVINTTLEGDITIANGSFEVLQGDLDLGESGNASNAANITITETATIRVPENGTLNVFDGSQLDAGDNPINIIANNISFQTNAGSFISTSEITITPATAGNNIFVGNIADSKTASDGLRINQTDYSKMQSPNLTIGGAGYNGTITVENVTGALGRLNLIADGTGGAINLSGGVDLDGKDASGISLYIQGSGATTDLSGITSVAGDMIISDAVRVVGDSKLASTDGNITVTGGTDGIYSASGSNNDLELYAYNGTIIAGNQTGFGDNSGADSLIDNLLMWGENTTIGDGNHAISGLFDTWLYPLMILGTGSTDLSAGGFFTNDIQGNSNNLTFTGSSAYFVGSISDVLDLTYNGNGSDDDVSLTNNVTTTGDQNWNVPVLQLRDNEGDPSENLILTAGGDVTISELSRNQGFAKSGSILSNLNLTIDATGNVAIDGVSFSGSRDVALGNVTISNAANVSLGGGFSDNGTGNGIDGNLIMTGISDTVTLNATSGSSYLIGGELSIDSAHVVVDANVTLETAGDLSIMATGSTGNSRSGIDVNAAAGGTTTLRALGSSNITLNGTSGDQWSTNAEGVELGDTAGGNVLVETASGDITIVGVAAGNADEGIVIEAATIRTTAGGSIAINGTAGQGDPSNTTALGVDHDGISIEANSSIVTQAGGDISITGVASNQGEGIDLEDGTNHTITATSGNIVLQGTGDATSASDAVVVSATAITAGGNLTINGTGGSNGTLDGTGSGIYLQESSVVVDGDIAFNGTTRDGNGIELNLSQLSSTSGNMTFTGDVTGHAVNGTENYPAFLMHGSSLVANNGDVGISFNISHPTETVSSSGLEFYAENGTPATINAKNIDLVGITEGVSHGVTLWQNTALEASETLTITGIYNGPAEHGVEYQYGVAVFPDVTLTADNLGIAGKTTSDDGWDVGFENNNTFTGHSSVWILADNQEWDYDGAPAISVQGNGSLELAPYPGSTDFDWDINLANVDFGTTFTSAKLGVPTATGYDLRVGTQGLRVNGPIEIYGGTPTIDGEIASTAEGQSVLIQGASGIEVGKNISTTNGALTLQGTATVTDSVVLSSGSGVLDLTGKIVGEPAGQHKVTINTTGTATIVGAENLSEFVFNGGTIGLQGNVTTSDSQTYNGTVQLDGDTILQGFGLDLGSVDGNKKNFGLDFQEVAVLDGNFTNINDFTSGGNVSLSGNFVTLGSQTYNANVSLTGDSKLAGTTLSLSSGITGGGYDLDLDFSQATTLNGGITGIKNLKSGGDVSFNGTVATSGYQEYNANASLAANTTLQGTALTLANGLDGQNKSLDLNFSNTTFLNDNYVNISNLTSEGGVSLSGNITTSGTQSYKAAANLTENITLEGTALTFANGVDGNNKNLVLKFSQTTSLDGNFTNINDLTSEGDVSLNGNLTTLGDQTYQANASLAGSVVLQGETLLFSSGVNGANYNFGLNFSQVAALNGKFENIHNLTSNGDVSISGTIQTVEDQTYNANVSLAGNTTLEGNSATFTNGVVGGNHDLLLDFDVHTQINSDFVDIDGFTVTGPATVEGNLSAGTIDLQGNLILSGHANLTASRSEFAPTEVGNLSFTEDAVDVALSSNGQYAFVVVKEQGLEIIDVSNPASPTPAGNLSITSGGVWGPVGVTLSSDEQYAFVSNFGGGLEIIDVSDVSNPTAVGNFQTSGAAAYDVALSSDGQHAFVASYMKGLQIVNISDKTAPTLAGSLDTDGLALGVTLSSDGEHAFVADGTNGLQIIDVSDVSTPTSVGNLAASYIAWDVVLSSDDQYAFVTEREAGLRVIDVSNVSAPTQAGHLDTVDAYRVTLSSDDQYAFVADQNAGLQIIDVSNVSAPTPAGNLDTDGWAVSVTLSSDEQRAFVAGENAGLQIIDLAPGTPVAQPVQFGGTVDGGFGLAVTASNVTFSGIVGGVTAIGSFTAVGDTTTRLGGGKFETSGSQSFGGAVTLLDNANLVGGSLALANGLAGGGNDLTLEFTESMVIDGDSVFSGIGNLSVIGDVALNATIMTTGFQNYSGSATLLGDTSLFTGASGDVGFGSTVDGSHDLSIEAGVGRIDFFGALGSTAPLQGLNLASASAVEALDTLAIDGAGGSGPGLRFGPAVDNVNISQPGSTITNAAQEGILFAGGSANSTVGGFAITNSGASGVAALTGSYTGSIFSNSTVTGSANDGFAAFNADGLSVTDSEFSTNAGDGIHFDAVSNATAQNNVIGNNDFYGVLVVSTDPLANTSNVSVTGNFIGTNVDEDDTANGRSGIWVLGNARGHGTVDTVSITGNTIANNAVHGIEVWSATNVTLGGTRGESSENIISNNAQYGIAFTDVVTNSVVHGNTLLGNIQAGLYLNSARGVTVGGGVDGKSSLDIQQSDFGVVAGGDLTGTNLVGNRVHENRQAGFQLLSAREFHLFRNTIENNGPYGVLAIGDSNNSRISGNTISRHGAGVWLAGASGMVIGSLAGVSNEQAVGNKIEDNSSVGIIIQGEDSFDNVILSNQIDANIYYGIQFIQGARTVSVPRLVSVTTDQITGRITGDDGEVYRIQFFYTPAAQAVDGRTSQGEFLIGYEDVTIVDGAASISLDISSSDVVAGDVVTATATLMHNGTPSQSSSFSQGRRVQEASV